MSRYILEDLPALASCDSDRELLESFYFRCCVKNLTKASLKNYGERLRFLMLYASDLNRNLDELTEKDLQVYVMSILKKVSPATVNGRIASFLYPNSNQPYGQSGSGPSRYR
jgi:hypothetical protein